MRPKNIGDLAFWGFIAPLIAGAALGAIVVLLLGGICAG